MPLIASLPQALLARGALAVIAHVDRAFSYGFEDVMGTPQEQLLRTPLELLMKGQRVGTAADPLNLQWSTLAAQLGLALGGNLPGSRSRARAVVANLFIARDDARNYIVLGRSGGRASAHRSDRRRRQRAGERAGSRHWRIRAHVRPTPDSPASTGLYRPARRRRCAGFMFASANAHSSASSAIRLSVGR